MTFDLRPRGSCWVAAVAAAALVLGAGPASAERDPRAEARRRLEHGSQLYRRGDYEGALREFIEARSVYPSPKLYFNIGQALSRLGRHGAALDAFERFLAEATDAAPARRRDAEKFLVELRSLVGWLRVTAPAETAVSIDGQATGVAPLARPLPLEPGPHQIEARLPGPAPAVVASVEVTRGQTFEWTAPTAPPADGHPLMGPGPTAAPAVPPSAPSGGPASSSALPPALAPAIPSTTAAVSPAGEVASAPASPLLRRWWPWAIIGGALVAGLVTVLLVPRESGAPTGSLGFADLRRGSP